MTPPISRIIRSHRNSIGSTLSTGHWSWPTYVYLLISWRSHRCFSDSGFLFAYCSSLHWLLCKSFWLSGIDLKANKPPTSSASWCDASFLTVMGFWNGGWLEHTLKQFRPFCNLSPRYDSSKLSFSRNNHASWNWPLGEKVLTVQAFCPISVQVEAIKLAGGTTVSVFMGSTYGMPSQQMWLQRSMCNGVKIWYHAAQALYSLDWQEHLVSTLW